jgi:hypothetical protein
MMAEGHRRIVDPYKSEGAWGVEMTIKDRRWSIWLQHAKALALAAIPLVTESLILSSL